MRACRVANRDRKGADLQEIGPLPYGRGSSQWHGSAPGKAEMTLGSAGLAARATSDVETSFVFGRFLGHFVKPLFIGIVLE
jgi:hypothetical protein